MRQRMVMGMGMAHDASKFDDDNRTKSNCVGIDWARYVNSGTRVLPLELRKLHTHTHTHTHTHSQMKALQMMDVCMKIPSTLNDTLHAACQFIDHPISSVGT